MRHKFLALFIAILLFFSVCGVIFSWQFKAATKPDFVAKTLDQSGIYNKIDVITDNFFSSSNGEATGNIFARTIAENLDPAFVKSEVEKDLPNILSYFLGGASKTNVNIDLNPLKNKVYSFVKNSPDFGKIIDDEVANLEPCPSDYNFQPENGLTCIPGGATKEQISQALKIASNPQEIVNEIPDNFNLDAFKNSKNFAKFRRTVFLLRYTIYIFGGLTLIFLLILMLLSSGNFKRFLKWASWGLIIPSAMLIIFNLLSHFGVQFFLSNYYDNAEMLPVINLFLNNVFVSGLLISGSILFLGITLFIVSSILPEKTPSPTPPAKAV